jgi:UDP-glucose 4-epimerase
VDERHPSYNEDAYSLSKWVLEAQADSFARRYEEMTISSLRFHGLTKLTERRTRDTWAQVNETGRRVSANHLWAYTDIDAAARACELALLAEWAGHEAFFITAPTTIFDDSMPSLELARQHYPNVPIRADLPSNTGFYDCSKAGRLLKWTHEEQ